MKTVETRAGMKKPEDWIAEMVEPNLQDYLADPGAKHKALNAIVSANHIADRVAHFYDHYDKGALLGAEGEGDFLRRVIDKHQSIDLQLVFDACDATKHHFLRPSKEARMVTTATDAVLDTSAGFVIGDTDDYPVELAVRNVIDFWLDFRRQNRIAGVD